MFRDRHEAGKKLAEKLAGYRGTDALVLALPRGGVVLGYEVATALRLPLDIIAVRKIGHPFSPEYAIGAVDEDKNTIFNDVAAAEVDRVWLGSKVREEYEEAKRRGAAYRAGKNPSTFAGKTIIIVDDGIATGLTMRLAVRAAKAREPKTIIVAVPVAPPGSIRALKEEGAGEVIVLEPPGEFAGAVGAHYVMFGQVGDDEVVRLLHAPNDSGKEIKVAIDSVELEGTLVLPANTKGIVVFAHGSGSSRFSPRNMFVAEELQKAGVGTLLIDLLTQEEDEIYETRFNIDLLTERLGRVLRWIGTEPATKDLAVGLFGASTGAAAALKVAARVGSVIAAVVSRGGRPDLAMDVLPRVVSPTLLIVGGDDVGVIELNERALAALRSIRKLEIVPGATHLFEEAGALDKVAALASWWFVRYLVPARVAAHAHAVPEIPEEEGGVPPKFKNSSDTPTRPPGKTRSAAKEGYRHFHRKT